MNEFEFGTNSLESFFREFNELKVSLCSAAGEAKELGEKPFISEWRGPFEQGWSVGCVALGDWVAETNLSGPLSSRAEMAEVSCLIRNKI